MKNIHAKLFTFGLLTVVFVVAFLANQIASATDWHFGGYATAVASPAPSPAFVVAQSVLAAGASPTLTIPSGGSTPVAAGDCVVVTMDTTVQDPKVSTDGFGSWQVANKYAGGAALWQQTYSHQVTPQDITAGNLAFINLAANDAICAAYFRHAICTTDSVSANASANTSATPQVSSATTTLANDMNVITTIMDGNTGQTYTPPSSYTNAVYLAPVTGTAEGCALDYKLLGAAGANAPGTATLSASKAWGSIQLSLPTLGFLS